MDVSIRRSKKARRIAIHVSSKGEVELVLPRAVSERVGMAFLQERAGWIAAMLKKQEQARSALEPVRITQGASIFCFGQMFTLDIQLDAGRARSSVRLNDETVIVSVSDSQKVLSVLTAFYVARAKEYFAIRTHELAGLLGKQVKKIRAIDMKTQWGSCNSAVGALTFNWRLALAPEYIARYVVAHEVAHLAHPNHSKSFWKTVEMLDSGYATSRAWLRKYGSGLYMQ